MERFIKELDRVSNENLMLISEIEYAPSRSVNVLNRNVHQIIEKNTNH